MNWFKLGKPGKPRKIPLETILEWVVVAFVLGLLFYALFGPVHTHV
jgi:hypothetical protein